MPGGGHNFDFLFLIFHFVFVLACEIEIDCYNNRHKQYRENYISVCPACSRLLPVFGRDGSVCQPADFLVGWYIGHITDHNHDYHTHYENEQTVILKEDIVHNPKE